MNSQQNTTDIARKDDSDAMHELHCNLADAMLELRQQQKLQTCHRMLSLGKYASMHASKQAVGKLPHNSPGSSP